MNDDDRLTLSAWQFLLAMLVLAVGFVLTFVEMTGRDLARRMRGSK